MKRNKSVFMMALMLTLSVFLLALGGCAGGGNALTEYLMNGYEDYYDLAWTSVHGDLFGEISINDNKKYITEGNGSAKFALDYRSDFGSPDQNGDTLQTGIFKYEVSNYENTFKWLDKINSFSIDIYNDSAYEFDLYFAAGGDESAYFLSDGTVLAANGWNKLRFEVKPYFFGKDTAVKEYLFYLSGVEKIPDKKATLYVDNFRAEVYAKQPSVPTVGSTSELSFGGIELLDFDEAADTEFIVTTSNTKSVEFLPLFYTQFDPLFSVGENKKGALKAVISQSHKEGLLWETGNGYDIRIHSEVLKKAAGAKTVAVTCFNPDTTAHYVTLVAGEGKKSAKTKAFVPSGGSVTVTLSDMNGILALDALTVRIDSWKLTGKSCLYFSQLRFTV